VQDQIVIYCLVPRGTPPRLMVELRKHYARTDPRVKVIEERRKSRAEDPIAPPDKDRTVSERRRRVVPRRLPALPPALAQETDDIFWVQHLVPVGEAMEALDDERLYEAVRARHVEAPAELYWRWYARLHSRLAVLLGDDQSADRATAEAFGRALDALEAPVGDDDDPERLIYGAVDACAGHVGGGDDGERPVDGIAINDPSLDEPLVLRDAEPMWASRALSERDQLLRALGAMVVSIEHVGSTAVENLPARPIIDLLVGVEQMPPEPLLMQALNDLYFEDCGEAGVPGRVYLRKRGWQRVELHIVQHRGKLWDDTLLFRDQLRHTPGAAHKWSRAKLAAEFEAAGSTRRYAELRRQTLEELLAAARGEDRQAATAEAA
jgi:GrpB-like predicted nucleotidyltransferase (UPF0157 family)